MTPAYPHALRRAGAGAVVAGLLMLSSATTAHAHDQLESSSPAADEHLDAAPDVVRLDYSAVVLTMGVAVVVVDAHDGTWTSGEPVIDGSSVTVPLAADMPDGSYEVRWRVVSSDGHAISGWFPFTVGDAVPATDESAVVAAEPAPRPTAAGDDGAPVASTDVTAPATSPWRTVGLGALGAVVAVGLYALVLVTGARRSTSARDGDGPAAT